ncbi:HupE/UreJ family protein [Roseateles oligotrophus]|uniref:HupE/UreJ family protein n=1 Tax=Roseateles oligotrophus TaxID=1769250 RepID=A0ABT2YKB6_9BURK|nr:HupE/UreJ family protein [Roseateles oligotrophus]MCV2370360.1 HupE/UreJ family protein [Roseateles oligotrophus]
MMLRLFKALLAGLALLSSLASAHEMSMAEMQLREMARGEFFWQWTASEKRAPAEVLKPIWPESCQVEGNVLHCGAAGLSGRMAMDGVGQAYSAVMVKVFWLDGQTRVYTLTGGQPSVQLYGAADDSRGMGEIARAYTLLGVEHILAGIDHLLFVIAMLMLVGFNSRLIWTISAFTLAHSLTLASSALGWLILRPPPVEAAIALSIVLVAAEALHQRQTIARRWPALVAFLFGLVHGLGFAGALKEIGLPDQHLLVALLTFNLGVEIGQLLTVAAAFALWRLSSRWPWAAKARSALLYAIGAMAAYWSLLRIVSIFA